MEGEQLFYSLPPETQNVILTYLENQDLGNLLQTSKRLSTILKTNVERKPVLDYYEAMKELKQIKKLIPQSHLLAFAQLKQFIMDHYLLLVNHIQLRQKIKDMMMDIFLIENPDYLYFDSNDLNEFITLEYKYKKDKYQLMLNKDLSLFYSIQVNPNIWMIPKDVDELIMSLFSNLYELPNLPKDQLRQIKSILKEKNTSSANFLLDVIEMNTL
jgi:hypothetical protein